MGFYAKGMDGRIDDPSAGWKGRGVWSTYANRTPFHLEGGKGTTSKVEKFQLRPDPLARRTSGLTPPGILRRRPSRSTVLGGLTAARRIRKLRGKASDVGPTTART